MKLYRFSPIKNEGEMYEAIEYMHFESHKLCKNILGKHLSNAGNVGVFCHYSDEYEHLTKLREKLTESSENFNKKYFRLNKSIVIPAKNDVAETTYDFLYIRQPDPYRHYVGDIDFYLEQSEYQKLKGKLENGKKLSGVRIYPSSNLDMIELHHPDNDVLVYVGTTKMDDIVRNVKNKNYIL